MVRCKMRLAKITESAGYPGSNYVAPKLLRFETCYDDKIPEDRAFADASPGGFMEIHVSNPAALAKFELGEFYYFDAIPCEEKAPSVTTEGGA